MGQCACGQIDRACGQCACGHVCLRSPNLNEEREVVLKVLKKVAASLHAKFKGWIDDRFSRAR